MKHLFQRIIKPKSDGEKKIIGKRILFFTLFLTFFLSLSSNVAFFYLYSIQNRKQNSDKDLIQKLELIDNKLEELKKSADERLLVLENNLNMTNEESKRQLEDLKRDYIELKQKPREIIREEIVKEKTQDELLTEAVAKITPAVVSIVITKDVPKLEVVYENPFGDDPFFKDFQIRIPTYRKKGVEEKKIGAGTGFLINQDGYIVTNRHVVEDENAHYTVLLADGKQKTAEIIYKDDKIDVAIIKVDSADQYIDFGDSKSLKIGQAVFAVGNVLGEYNNSVSIGIISGLDREISVKDNNGKIVTLQGVIQTDAAINPGNSGGPLVNMDGAVVGVNVATVLGSDNIGFAIPIDEIKEIISRQEILITRD